MSMAARKRALLNRSDWLSAGLGKSKKQSIQENDNVVRQHTQDQSRQSPIRSPFRKRVHYANSPQGNLDEIAEYETENKAFDINELIPPAERHNTSETNEPCHSNSSSATLVSDQIMDFDDTTTLPFLPAPYCFYNHISEIKDETLKLSFFHPCMSQDLGFPAVYARIKQDKIRERGRLEWPGCLKKMWTV